MRDVTKTVYSFDELTDEAKDRAVGLVREKLYGDWWDSSDIDDVGNEIHLAFAEALQSPGHADHGPDDFPGIDGVTLEAWDTDRRDVAFRGILTRENAPLLPWRVGLDVVWLRSSRTRSSVDPLNVDGVEASKEAHDEMIDAVVAALEEAILAGVSIVEHKTSEATAREWCENNEVQEYEEDGTLV